MKITRVKVRRSVNGEDAAAWAGALADPSWHAGSLTLKEGDGSWVKRAVLRGREVVIKCRPVFRADDRLKLILRASRGDRQWNGAEWLASHGFATARPLALATGDVDGMRAELLVTEFIKARSILEHLAARDLSARDEHELCRALARLIAGLIKHGRYNRDGKPSNLLVVRTPQGTLDVATIDTVAIRQTGPASHARLVAMLASLVIEPIGVGAEPRRSLKARVVKGVVELLGNDRGRRHIERLELWWHVSERVQLHGDPRPRVDPLQKHSMP
jgi:hypothetical protein